MLRRSARSTTCMLRGISASSTTTVSTSVDPRDGYPTVRISAFDVVYTYPIEDGVRVRHWHAVLFTEPLWRHVVGRWLDRLWWKLPKWAQQGDGTFGFGGTKHYDDGTVGLPWQLRLELWCSYDFRHNKKYYRYVETVPVADRDHDADDWNTAIVSPPSRKADE